MKLRTVAIRFLGRMPAVAAALAVIPLLLLVLRRGVNVPYWDEWEWAQLVYAAHTHTLTFAQLWAPHNEHRLLIPNLLMLALDAAGGWNVTREQIVSLVVLSLSQLAVWALICRTIARPRRGICFLVSTLLLMGLAQYENLEWGFQLAWFICDLGLVVAVWSLTVPSRGPGAVLTALVAATIASVSSSQGLLVWPAGLIAIVLVPRRLVSTAIAWIFIGACVTALVRAGVHGPDVGHAGLTHPGQLALYTISYLGAPMAVSFGSVWPAVAGGLLLAGFAGLAIVTARAPLARRVRLAPWIAIGTYPLLCAAVTATARSGFGVDQALSSRYISIGALAWVALAAGWFSVAPQVKGLPTKLAFATAVAVFALLSAKQSSYGNHMWRQHVVNLATARAALVRGDPRALSLIYPERARIELLLSELSTIHDGMFSGS